MGGPASFICSSAIPEPHSLPGSVSKEDTHLQIRVGSETSEPGTKDRGQQAEGGERQCYQRRCLTSFSSSTHRPGAGWVSCYSRTQRHGVFSCL